MSKKKKAITDFIDSEILYGEPILSMGTIDSTKKFSTPVHYKIDIKHKNKNQKEFTNLIENKEMIICAGPAGTGKSFLSLAKSLELLQQKNSPYRRIYLITPAVESEEKLGFLPGNLYEKLQPYLYSIYYLIDGIIGKENRIKMVEQGTIEPIAIGFLRGVNIDNSILIFEEAQNSSITTMKTLTTRIGRNSKFIISGDIEQIDNEKLKSKENSGLHFAVKNFGVIPEIGIFNFTQEDIVRNPLITKILNVFNKK